VEATDATYANAGESTATTCRGDLARRAIRWGRRSGRFIVLARVEPAGLARGNKHWLLIRVRVRRQPAIQNATRRDDRTRDSDSVAEQDR
jgi:hypothetical protein